MATRLIIQRPGDGLAPTDLTATARAGGGPGDLVFLPGAPEGAALLSPVPDGVVVEARCALSCGGHPLAPGGRRLLRRGERLEIAGCTLWPEPAPELDQTRALAAAILEGAAPLALSGPTLLGLEGPAAGRRLPLDDQASLLGRGGASTVRLEDPLASRRHLRLVVRGDTLLVEDLGSKNGVSVNGRRARGRTRLANGDVLRVGGSLLLFLRGPPEPCGAAGPASAAPPVTGPVPRRRAKAAALASGALAAAALALAAAAG